MHGFLSKEQFEPIIGKDIVQIAFGRNQIAITLHTQEFIVIESTLSFYVKNRALIEWKDTNPPILDGVLSRKIIDFRITSESEAFLVLDNSIQIALSDDSSEFETISFCLHDITIVV